MIKGWLITHERCLDGASAALVGYAAGLTVRFVEPDRVSQALEDIGEGEPIFLADVSLNPHDWKIWRHRITFVLDHHQSAQHLVGEPNAHIDLSLSGGPLFYRFAQEKGWLTPTPRWDRLMDAVRAYDLWKPMHDFGEDLNRLFHHLGFEWYLRRFSQGWVPFNAEEGALLAEIVRDDAELMRRQLRLAVRYQETLPYPIFGIELEHDGPINRVSHALLADGGALVLSRKPDKRLSCRTDARIDAAQVMHDLFSGGGHARAAGGRLKDDDPTDLVSLLAKVAGYLSSVAT